MAARIARYSTGGHGEIRQHGNGVHNGPGCQQRKGALQQPCTPLRFLADAKAAAFRQLRTISALQTTEIAPANFNYRVWKGRDLRGRPRALIRRPESNATLQLS